MEPSFEISFNIKTVKGLETYGSFFLGRDERFAKYIFGLMQGEANISNRSVISMDLIKRQGAFAYPVAILHCSWDHLAFNTKMITKEVFKQLNLEQNAS